MRGDDRYFSLPRWRMTRWLADAGRDVPDDIRAALVASLFGTLPIYVGGVVNTVLVSALIALYMPRPAFIAWFLLEIILCMARLSVLMVAHRAAQKGRETPTDIYIILGLLWALSVGYGCYISILSGDWVLATLACLSAAAMVGGICFRNFGAPRLVASMILFSLGPCAIAAVFSGQPILLMAAVQVPLYLFSMTIAAYRLNAMLVSTMVAERQKDHLARHDHLTGVLNRAGLMQEMAARLSPDGKALGRWTLFYVDLDGFKTVNDRYGHSAGDELLKQVATRLRAFGLPDAVFARIGGDEFVILCGIGDRAAAALTAERIVLELSSAQYDVGLGLARIGASIGIALSPDHGGDIETLLHAADTALYEAKSLGGRRCAIALEAKEVPRFVPLPEATQHRRATVF